MRNPLTPCLFPDTPLRSQSERQVVLVVLRRVGWWCGNLACRIRRVARVGSRAFPFSGVDELQRVCRNGELDLVVFVLVFPQRGRERSLNEQ